MKKRNKRAADVAMAAGETNRPEDTRPRTADAISRLRGSFPEAGAALDRLAAERKRDRTRGK